MSRTPQERYFFFGHLHPEQEFLETCYRCSVTRYGQPVVDRVLAGPENLVEAESDLAYRDIEQEDWPPGDAPGSWVCEVCDYELSDPRGELPDPPGEV